MASAGSRRSRSEMGISVSGSSQLKLKAEKLKKLHPCALERGERITPSGGGIYHIMPPYNAPSSYKSRSNKFLGYLGLLYNLFW